MERLSNIDIIEKEPLRWDYSRVMDVVYLGLCCNDNIEGSIQAGSFKALFPDETVREQHKAEFGARFDDAMISFVTTVMALRRKNIVLDMGDDHGITQDNRFYWEDELQKRLDLLNKKRKSSERLNVDIIKSPLPLQEEVHASQLGLNSDDLATRRSEGPKSDRGALAA